MNLDTPPVKETYPAIKAVISYRRAIILVQTLVGLVHQLLFRISPVSPVIEKDVYRWIREDRRNAAQSHFPAWKGLGWLLWYNAEFRNLFYYRIMSCQHLPSRLLVILAQLIYRPLPALYFYTPSIGPGLFIQHGFSTVIAADSIGEHCWVNQQVTIGWDDADGCPTIGNNVRIAAGAVVFGKITIGDNVVIGANALVSKSVPANCTVVGVPAYIVKRDGKRVREEL